MRCTTAEMSQFGCTRLSRFALRCVKWMIYQRHPQYVGQRAVTVDAVNPHRTVHCTDAAELSLLMKARAAYHHCGAGSQQN